MRYLAAYLLLVIGGNETPTAEDVNAVLSKAGIEGSDDTGRLDSLIAELEGKDVAELIALGREKLYVGGGGGGGAASAAPAGGAAPAAAGAAAAPAAKEEKPKVEEVDALDGGMDMFGGGGGGGGDY